MANMLHDVFTTSDEKMIHYIDMVNADIQHSLNLHGERCINCAYYRYNDIGGYPGNEHCDKSKYPINNPTSAVCCDYKFMGFLGKNFEKSVDKDEGK